tara:strand:- start:303 stop:587 length:285 start_codon:yes stop_codon:yes gene_type:complete
MNDVGLGVMAGTLAYKLSLLRTRLERMADPVIDVNDISPLPSDDMSIDDIRRHDARELLEGIALTDDEGEFLINLSAAVAVEHSHLAARHWNLD